MAQTNTIARTLGDLGLAINGEQERPQVVAEGVLGVPAACWDTSGSRPWPARPSPPANGEAGHDR
jgi:hypothetical protein